MGTGAQCYASQKNTRDKHSKDLTSYTHLSEYIMEGNEIDQIGFDAANHPILGVQT